MNWQNNDFFTENENNTKTNAPEHLNHPETIQVENEQKKVAQLRHLNDKKTDEQIQKYITALTQFGNLLLQNNKGEITRDLMTDDCEFFLFNLADITEVRYGFKHEGLVSVYQDIDILQRDGKEIYVDKEKQTAFQISFFKIYNKKDDSFISQFSFEVFSFRDDKIRKYRASFGSSASYSEFEHPFTPSRKDTMLAKVRELNLAWADQPDLKKIASLLHESIEYKLWSWEDQKGFTFNKYNFATEFKNIEANYSIKCVVPYEAYSEGQYIMANYVYHLEGKHDLSGENFLWLSSCIYAFDKNLNFAKINQQGELYKEDEMLIPFNGSSRENMIKLVQEFSDFKVAAESDWGIINNDKMNFSYEISRFGPSFAPNTGTIKGFSDYGRLMKVFQDKKRNFEFTKSIDTYIDCYNSSYDVAIMIDCSQGAVERDNYKYSGKTMNYYSIRKLCFENGKVAKLMIFFSEIPEEIPSPYDDESFSAMNVKSRNREFKND